MEVVCKLIVFHKPSILRLVLGDNRIDRVIDQFPSMDGFAIFHVGLAFLSQRIRWDAHLDLPVDLPLLVKLGSVVLHDRDVVIEEPRGFGFGMGNQRFLFGELQLERFMQELPEEPFDLLCFFPWPSDYVSLKVNPFDPLFDATFRAFTMAVRRHHAILAHVSASQERGRCRP